jgi:hypothetical protein
MKHDQEFEANLNKLEYLCKRSTSERDTVCDEVLKDYLAKYGQGKREEQIRLMHYRFQVYKDLLQNADWFYMKKNSDEYRNGHNHFYRIWSYQRGIDPDRKMFYAYRPEGGAMPTYSRYERGD